MKKIYKEYTDLTQEVSKNIEGKLKEIADLDIDELMSDVENLLVKDYKIHYSDNDTIMVKVDRRKNIDVIIKSIEEKLEALVGTEQMKLLFKTRVTEGMVTIKRRR